MTSTLTEYDKQAKDFLKATNTTFKAKFLKNGIHFEGDKETRDIYLITLKRGNRVYKFNFGQSIANSEFYYTKGVQEVNIDRKFLELSNSKLVSTIKRTDWNFLNNGKSDKIVRPVVPTEYDVLACLTKYDPETFENFCDEFGYNTGSRAAEKTYKAVVNEYQNVMMLWNDSEIEQLTEIQ